MHAALSRAPVEAITEEQFHKLFNVNVLSLLLTGAAALRFQKGLDSKKKQKAKGGRDFGPYPLSRLAE
jgi:NAD(P)-dependent dehydrogenase (short-subunit alcohol dehydrogenase family)